MSAPLWTADEVMRRLKRREKEPPHIDLSPNATDSAAVGGRREALRRAAAVMGAFDPEKLHAVGESEGSHVAVAPGFSEDCTFVVDASGRTRWILKPMIRRQVLASMDGPTTWLEALNANADLDADDPIRRMIRKALQSEGSVELNGLSAIELSTLARIAGWSEMLARRVGPASEILREGERKALFVPFEALAARQTFAGRRNELRDLRSFVDALESEGALEAVMRLKSRIERSLVGSVGAYVIHAPGGMGKSALIARFILDHPSDRSNLPLLFVYLDWEVPSLVPQETETMLIEILRQLELQFPGEISQSARRPLEVSLCEHRERSSMAVLASQSIGSTDPHKSVASGSERHLSLDERYQVRTAAAKAREDLLVESAHEIGFEIRTLAKRLQRPVLIVLDTFERVQRYGRAEIETVRRPLEIIQTVAEAIRVVIASRAQLNNFILSSRPPTLKTLGPLDREAATTLLARLDIPTADADRLASKLGGNPLSLMLAARIYKKRGLIGVDDVGKGRWSFFSADEVEMAEIQGRLYDRYLDQIDDPDLRKLAHSGLILRRIDATSF